VQKGNDEIDLPLRKKGYAAYSFLFCRIIRHYYCSVSIECAEQTTKKKQIGEKQEEESN